MLGMNDPLRMLDAVYCVELDETAWLKSLADCLSPSAATACTYDASDGGAWISNVANRNGALSTSEIARALSANDGRTEATFTDMGSVALFVLNGIDASGYGVWIGTPCTRSPNERAKLVQRWNPVVKHLGRAIALRRKLDAVFPTESKSLTGREREVLAFAAAGNTTKLIA